MRSACRGTVWRGTPSGSWRGSVGRPATADWPRNPLKRNHDREIPGADLGIPTSAGADADAALPELIRRLRPPT